MSHAIKKTITEGVAWTSLGVFVTKVVAIVNVLLVLSHLSVYEYGVVELVISVPALLGILSLPGLEIAITADSIYEKSKGNLQKVRYFLTSYFSLRMILGAVAAVGLFASASFVESYYNSDIGLMIQIISIVFLVGPLRSIFHIIFKIELHFKALSLYSFFEELGKFAVLSIIIFFFELNAVMIIVAYVLTDIIALILLTPVFLRCVNSTLKGVPFGDGWRHPLYTLQAHGKWSIFSTYLGMFGQNIRPWIIKVFLGTEMVGLYGLALGMYRHTAALLPISGVIGPLVPRYLEEKKKLYRLINSAIKYQFFSLVLSAVSMAVFFPVLIDTFFPDYAASYPLYLLLLFAFIPASFSAIFEPTFHALKAQKNLFYIGILRLTMIACFLPLAVYFLGVYGIAVEFFITWVVYVFERYRKLKKLLPGYHLSLQEMFNFSSLDRLILGKLISVLKNMNPLCLFSRKL